MTAPTGLLLDLTQLAMGDTLPEAKASSRVLGQGDRRCLAGGTGRRPGRPRRPHLDDNQRLQDEAEVLRQLYSEYIVSPRRHRDGWADGAVLGKAGDADPDERLPATACSAWWHWKAGMDNCCRCSSRWRNASASHWDVKPHNIAVRTGKEHAHLVLDFFAVARAVDNVFVGTAAYPDPPRRENRPRGSRELPSRACRCALYEARQ